jgi:LasA protease
MTRSTFLAVALLLSAVAGTASGQVREGPPPSPPRAATNVTYPVGYTEPWVEDSTFVYGPSLLGFDVAAYLGANAPHLVSHAEVISHWCGFYSVSPKVLLAVLEARSGVLTSPGAIADPTAGLVAGASFDDQVQALLAELTEDFYAFRGRSQAERDAAGMNAATFALVNAFRNDATIEAFAPAVESARESFIGMLTRLFPEALLDRQLDVSIDAIPPTDLIQMPWTLGDSWYFNGVHTNSGNNSGPRASIDFTRIWQLWGGNVTTDYVVASLPGTVTVFSSCQVRVTSLTGWAVNYYHLDQIQVTTGQQVTPNQRLAAYAGNESQALCQGGSSTGPHVHFTLIQDGFFSALDGATLGTYLVHSGQFDYDDREDFMWLERNGTRYYAYQHAIQSYPPSTPPTISVNDVKLSEGDAGTKNATFTVSLSAAAGIDVTFSYATSANATATAGSDFVTASGSAAITAGATSRTLDVTVNGDTAVEASETFALNLSSPSYGTLGDSQGVATIINDDFTDPTLSGATVKVAHITELRTLINERRAMRGLAAFTFTDPTLTAESTIVKAIHVVEMRSALAEVYTNAGQAAPVYTDPTLTAESTAIKAVHLTELRTNAVNAP